MIKLLSKYMDQVQSEKGIGSIRSVFKIYFLEKTLHLKGPVKGAVSCSDMMSDMMRSGSVLSDMYRTYICK